MMKICLGIVFFMQTIYIDPEMLKIKFDSVRAIKKIQKA